MKLPCEVIRDVLPLYAEDMVSPATKEIVDEHLQGCEGCTRELEELKGNKSVPVEVELHGLQRIQKEIRLRRVLAVLAVLMTLVTIGVTAYVFLNVPVYLSVGDAIEGVYMQEDGGLVIDYARGCGSEQGITDEQNNKSFFRGTTRYIWYQARKVDRMLETMTDAEIENYIKEYFQTDELTQRMRCRFYDNVPMYYYAHGDDIKFRYGEEAPETIEDGGRVFTKTEHPYNIAYVNEEGEPDTMLWMGSDAKIYWMSELETDNSWEKLFLVCLILFVVVMFWYFLFPKAKYREWKFALAMLFACIAVSVALVSNLSFSVTSLSFSREWKNYVLLESPVLFVTTLIWRKIFCEYKADRAL